VLITERVKIRRNTYKALGTRINAEQTAFTLINLYFYTGKSLFHILFGVARMLLVFNVTTFALKRGESQVNNGDIK
jgi:hypothetical protein